MADLTPKRVPLKIPVINGDFETIVIDNKYGLFVAAIIALNDDKVDQSSCEQAWKGLVYKKFYKWQPENMTIKEKDYALGEALAQVHGYPGFDPYEWWNDQSPIRLASAKERVLAAQQQLRIARGLVRALTVKELLKSGNLDLENAVEPTDLPKLLSKKRKHEPKQGV